MRIGDYGLWNNVRFLGRVYPTWCAWVICSYCHVGRCMRVGALCSLTLMMSQLYVD